MALDFSIAGEMALADFGQPITITLSGTTVKTVTGIFDLNPVTVSPGEMEFLQIDAALTISDTDMVGITSDHHFGVGSKIYRMKGKPRPDGYGFTWIPLSVQK